MLETLCSGVVRPWSRESVNVIDILWTTWEISPIYNLGPLGNKGEEIQYWDQKVKDQGHDETKYGQKSTFTTILSPQNTKQQ